MTFVVGEVDISPLTTGKIVNNLKALATSRGTRCVLLDSVRDAAFLSPSANDALGNQVPDMGLGVVDNGLFVYTTKFVPGKTTVPRQFPVKFFWIGSQAGTNDINDNFSLFVADVNQNAFYPGVPASAWLLNPRLVLSWQQAKADIVNWFDSNYPGGASGGKGSGNSGNNSTYGILAGGSSANGDISGMNSLDGQFWPLYDYVDDSIILYFSIKTPNVNTLSIYSYKIKDSEISSAITSEEFLGGVYGAYGSEGSNNLLSSHRFSIVSPDPLVTNARVKGQQSAVIAYAFGALDGSTPDHSRYLVAGFLQDIHGSPLNWNSNLQYSWASANSTAQPAGVHASGMYSVDKLGAITPIAQGSHGAACYAFLYNATTNRDQRLNSNKIVINAMQVRVGYIHLDPVTNMAFGDAIKQASETETIGHCRPQFTTLPDGLPKIIFADFNFDQSLRISCEYISEERLKPENQNALVVTNDVMPNPIILPSYGKRRATVVIGAQDSSGQSLLPTSQPNTFPTAVQVSAIYGNTDANWGFQGEVYYEDGSLILLDETTTYSFLGETNTILRIGSFTLEDLAPYTRLFVIGGTNSNNMALFEVIKLE